MCDITLKQAEEKLALIVRDALKSGPPETIKREEESINNYMRKLNYLLENLRRNNE